MSEKRRDYKNRVLRNGESQRSDKRYAYKYMDIYGKPQFAYSWKLEKTDKLPKGKRDDLIRKNSFEFCLSTVVVNDSVTREAITRKQERQYLEFVKNDKHFSRYYDTIYILFHTGLRISEFCGLIKDDIDLKDGKLRIERQLQRTRDMQYIIEDTKTPSGVRYVPMTKEVMNCFRHILENRENLKTEPIVSDVKGNPYHGFLFFDKNGRPMVAQHWDKYMQHIREKYNKIYKVQMPDVTPHVCRHTFCSNMANSE